MLSCQEASHLISEHQERSLTTRERLGLRLHLWLCISCRRFERQIALLRQALRLLGQRALSGTDGPDLPPAARDRIRKAMADRAMDTPDK